MNENSYDETAQPSNLAKWIDRVCDKFEDAWRGGQRPVISLFVAECEESVRPRLLEELISIDLEWRIQSGEPARVEEYLKSWPEITSQPEVVLALIQSEYEVRLRAQEGLSLEEYLVRFPDYRTELLDRLSGERTSESPRSTAFQMSCPWCHRPLTITNRRTEQVTCPMCGDTFRIAQAESTTSTHAQFSSPQLPTSQFPARQADMPNIGHFQLIEELGRGSFGTVYKALDTRLDRHVALKIPRAGQLSTAGQTQAFVREARNAAQLQHPGVVTVHEVGCEGELPFIASELVEGITLGEAMLRRPFSLREAAALVAQLAETLEYAHQQGVVHRDIKPSNVMLQSSPVDSSQSHPSHSTQLAPPATTGTIDRGAPRLMDFGLAKQERTAVTVTVEGQILGTPAYMSPQQARGESHRVDGRTDVYSLGVILYQLLTGELPFRGAVRMVMLQVIHDEPRSPRSLNDKVPRDLETIVLKCMAKDPDRRYDSAAAMAADLRRYLDGQPVLARPVGRIEKTWRWCRRKPMAATVAAMVVLIAVVSPLIAWRFHQLAEQQTSLAVKMRVASEKATRSRKDADRNFADAENAVKDLLTLVSEEELLHESGMQPVRRRLLQRALDYYQGFIQRRKNDERLRSEFATAYFRVGEITELMESAPAALEAHQESLRFRKQLAAKEPKAQVLYDLAASHVAVGSLLHKMGQSDEGRQHLKQAIEIVTPTDSRQPDHLSEFTRANHLRMLGDLEHQTGNLLDALEALEQAKLILERHCTQFPDRFTEQCALAATYNSIGVILVRDWKLDEAAAAYASALLLLEKVAAENPDHLDIQFDRAGLRHNLGMVHKRRGDLQDANRVLDQALAEIQKLADDNPTVVRFQSHLAQVHTEKGIVSDDPQQALNHHKQALRIRQQLVAEHPSEAEYLNDLATCWNNIGGILERLGKPEQALENFLHAVETREKLLADNPNLYQTRLDLAGTYDVLARHYHIAGNLSQSSEACRRAAEIRRHLAENKHASIDLQSTAAHRLVQTGTMQIDIGRPEDALETFDQAQTVVSDLLNDHPNNVSLLHVLWRTFINRGSVHWANGRTGKAFEEFQSARESVHRLTELDPSPANRMLLARTYKYLGNAQKGQECLASYQSGLELMEQIVEEQPSDENLRQLAGMRHNMGVELLTIGKAEESLVQFERAKGILADLAKRNPASLNYLESLGLATKMMGSAMKQLGLTKEALDTLLQAVEMHKTLATMAPEKRVYRADLAHTSSMIAVTYLKKGEPQKAAQYFKLATEGLDSLTNKTPGEWFLLAQTLAVVGSETGDTASDQRAIEALRSAITGGFQDIRAIAEHPNFKSLQKYPDFQQLLEQDVPH